MKKKFAMNKHTFFIAFCILAIAIMAVILIHNLNSGTGFQDEVSHQSPSPAAQAPSVEETTGVKEPAETNEIQYSPGKITRIHVYTVDRDLGKIIERYGEEHWDFDFLVNSWTDAIVYSSNDILSMINDNLNNGTEAMDIYCVPGNYIYQYAKGEYSEYACPYNELGIDVVTALKKADIPQYFMDAGSNQEGELVALPYIPDLSVFMYRRSIAREVWGTDDPDEIAKLIGGGTRNWDKFLEAAQTLKEHDCYILPGFRNMSAFVNSAISVSELTNESLLLNPEWEEFMDISKYMIENGYIKHPAIPEEQYLNDVDGGDKVFGFITDTDLYDYLQYFGLENTFGDWAICVPPFITESGLSGIMVNKHSPNKDLLGPLIEWITLDCSETGLQYALANGTLAEGRKISVISGTVLKEVDGSRDILGGQNINPVLYDALHGLAGGHQDYGIHPYAFGEFLDQTEAYLNGEKDKEAAIADFMNFWMLDWRIR